jgi:predicted nucleotidyltransferase
MKFGLNQQTYQQLNTLLLSPIKALGFNIYLFGSRAKGTHHPFSDVDLLLVGDKNNEQETQISIYRESIENSDFPYKVDIVFDTDLAKSYREQVEKEKILI